VFDGLLIGLPGFRFGFARRLLDARHFLEADGQSARADRGQAVSGHQQEACKKRNPNMRFTQKGGDSGSR